MEKLSCPQVVTFPACAPARATPDGSSTPTPHGDSTVALYALLCPKTGEVRYIGKAKDPYKRYAQHLRESGRLRRQLWISKCLREGRAPGMRVLCWVPENQWEDEERRLIAEHRTPSLLNIADGGNQPKPSAEHRRASGAQLHARIADDRILRANMNLLRRFANQYKLLKTYSPERSQEYDGRLLEMKRFARSRPSEFFSAFSQHKAFRHGMRIEP